MLEMISEISWRFPQFAFHARLNLPELRTDLSQLRFVVIMSALSILYILYLATLTVHCMTHAGTRCSTTSSYHHTKHLFMHVHMCACVCVQSAHLFTKLCAREQLINSWHTISLPQCELRQTKIGITGDDVMLCCTLTVAACSGTPIKETSSVNGREKNSTRTVAHSNLI